MYAGHNITKELYSSGRSFHEFQYELSVFPYMMRVK